MRLGRIVREACGRVQKLHQASVYSRLGADTHFVSGLAIARSVTGEVTSG